VVFCIIQIRRCFSADAGVARPTVKILFGSQTGNATLLGNQLAKQARDRGWEADLIDLHEFDHVRVIFSFPRLLFLLLAHL
jgi:sulfite reductase alpha subunit-like flavoprotein